MIYIGDTPLQERVEIPVFHTSVFGQSGTGKTKLLKLMISQAIAEGYHILIFDSKVTGPEFEGIGRELPFYLEQSTDPDVYRSLIEGIRPNEKGNMEFYRGGFIEICEPEGRPPAEDFADIGENLKLKLDASSEVGKRIHGRTRMMYREIQRDHEKLMAMLADNHFETKIGRIQSLVDNYPMTRMPTWKLPNLALQGLVVKSVVEWVLRNEEKVVILIDEAPNFVNQKKYNPAKSALQLLDAQGRSKEVFGWYSGQTLTGFDKSNMKNLWYWIMGREMEKNEAQDVFDTQTYKVRTVSEVKQLKVREFIVSTPDYAKLVTVPFVDEKALFGADFKEALAESTEQTRPVMEALAAREEDWSDVEKRVQEVEAKLSG